VINYVALFLACVALGYAVTSYRRSREFARVWADISTRITNLEAPDTRELGEPKATVVGPHRQVDPPRFLVYSVGLAYASVCTSLSDEEATAALNREYPTGIGPWSVSEDETFASGEPNSHPCPVTPGHRHILFNC
jgi:hypothetical protein